MTLQEIREKLQELAMATPAVDAHTHVQDDLTGFTRDLAPAIWLELKPR